MDLVNVSLFFNYCSVCVCVCVGVGGPPVLCSTVCMLLRWDIISHRQTDMPELVSQLPHEGRWRVWRCYSPCLVETDEGVNFS